MQYVLKGSKEQVSWMGSCNNRVATGNGQGKNNFFKVREKLVRIR